MEGVGVVKLADDLLAGDKRGRTLGGWIKNDHLDAERRGGLGEHAAELTAAHDAERRARKCCHTREIPAGENKRSHIPTESTYSSRRFLSEAEADTA